MYEVTFRGFSNESSHKGLHGNYAFKKREDAQDAGAA